MKKTLITLLFIPLAFLLLPLALKAQGCSDAGFCTMGAMKPDQHLKTQRTAKLLSMQVSQYVARTKFEDYICATTLEANIALGSTNKNSMQVKLPYMVIFNFLENTQGLGDISLSYTRLLFKNEQIQVSGTLGAKIPTNKANKTTRDGLPLPMYQQTSLGTYDAIMGVSVLAKGWLIATGIQQPVINENYNEFTWKAWRTALPAGDARRATQDKVPMSKRLVRKADVMLRVERNIRFKRMDWHVGLLGIYKLQRPTFIDGTGERVENATAINAGVRTEVETKSAKGLALSAIIGFTHHLSAKSALQVVYGDALIRREKNPDGLSREQVYTVGYQYTF